MQRETHAIELGIEQLAEFVFVKNVNDAIIEMELNGIEDVRDLYCFCVDLLCKGLVLLCAKDGLPTVDLDSISIEEFGLVARKMLVAGIKVNMAYEQNTYNVPSQVNMGTKYASDPLPQDNINEFIFKIVTPITMYSVSFQLQSTVMKKLI